MEKLYSLVTEMSLGTRMLILFGLALLVSTIIILLVYSVLRATARRTNSYTLEEFTKRTRSSAFWLLSFGLTLTFWTSILPVAENADPDALPPLVRAFQLLARTMLYITSGAFVLRVADVGADSVRHRYRLDDTTNLRERKILTQLTYIRKIVAIAIIVIFGALILMQFQTLRSLGTTLLTTAGVGGIVIGFAAQESIANLLAGFQIAFTQPIRIDDVLIVNGEFGTVEEITLTYVTMKLWDQRRQIVPLRKFIDDTFENWTRSSPELTGSVLLYVDYSMPVGELRAEAIRYAHTNPLFDGRAVSCLVTDCSEKTMTCRIVVTSNNSGNTFTLRCETREHLICWIQSTYPECLPKGRVGNQTSNRATLNECANAVDMDDDLLAEDDDAS